MLRRYLPSVIALMVATAAFAVDIEGVRIDNKASVGGQDLVLNGAGVRKRAIFKLYVGSLYVPTKSRSMQEVLASGPRRIQLNILRNLSADQLIGAVADGLKQNLAPGEMEAVAIPLGELAAIMKSFGEAKEGSVVTLDFVDGGTKISLNGAPQGTVDGRRIQRGVDADLDRRASGTARSQEGDAGRCLTSGGVAATVFWRGRRMARCGDRRFPAQLPRAPRACTGARIVGRRARAA